MLLISTSLLGSVKQQNFDPMMAFNERSEDDQFTLNIYDI